MQLPSNYFITLQSIYMSRQFDQQNDNQLFTHTIFIYRNRQDLSDVRARRGALDRGKSRQRQ